MPAVAVAVEVIASEWRRPTSLLQRVQQRDSQGADALFAETYPLLKQLVRASQAGLTPATSSF